MAAKFEIISLYRGYVVEKGLDKVVTVAKLFTENMRDVEKARVGTGILEHLFKHSETTCRYVYRQIIKIFRENEYIPTFENL